MASWIAGAAFHRCVCQIHSSQTFQHPQLQNISTTGTRVSVTPVCNNFGGFFWLWLENRTLSSRCDTLPLTFVLLFFLSTTPRTQLNYYGFIHVRSFSTTGSTTTALWVNRDLASSPGSDDIDAVLTLRRVEPCESAKTVDGRRSRKEQALHTVEEDLGVSAKSLQMDQIRHLAWQHVRGDNDNDSDQNGSTTGGPSLWSIMVCVPSDPPALNLALRPPPPLALLPSPILPVEVKTKTTATKSPNRDDDQASAANLLLLLSKAS